MFLRFIQIKKLFAFSQKSLSQFHRTPFRSFYSKMEKLPETDLLKKRTHEESIQNDDPEDNMSEKNEGSLNGDKLAPGEIDPMRVCLQGIDQFANERDILKFLKSSFDPPLQVASIAKSKGKTHSFVCFESVEDKERFEKEVLGKKMKNRKIKVRPVKLGQATLKFEKKVKLIEESFGKQKQPQSLDDEAFQNEMAQPIQEKVCPLWKTPYEEQIKIKSQALTKVLTKITTMALKQHDENDIKYLPKWLQKGEIPCCELTGFLEADENARFYYRNKGEFTIGESYDFKGETKVGFNKGNFSKGYMFVESAQDCPVVSKESLKLAQMLEEYIKESKIPAYHRVNHTGFWRNLIIRQSAKTSEILINVVGARKAIAEEDLNRIKQGLIELFTQTYKDEKYKIVSIVLQDHSEVSDSVPHDAPYEILYGNQDYFMDEILEFKFRVNVNAFLQVNSPQCQKLYSLIKKLADVDENTIFLDICCGIGTIGICCASQSKKIIGVEMVERAVKDAEFNSEINGLKNTEFIASKVESVISEIIKPYAGKNKIIGVVDPPRSGLHRDVVKALRTCKGLDSLIYVSCNPEGTAIDNILGLCLPENKKRRGPPFTVIDAWGVDLFPQTPHYEGVFLLRRLYEKNYQ